MTEPGHGTDRIAVLSCDTDWIPEEIALEAHELLCSLGKPITYFVTGRYSFQDGPASVPLEFAPHPNLTADDPEPEVDAAMRLTPGAVSFRAHALRYSSRLRPVLRKHGIRFSSSAMTYLQPGLRPYPLGHELVELPIFWMDAFHLEYCELGHRPVLEVPLEALSAPGLKVLDVHPLHLALNTQSREHYQSAKPSYHDADALRGARRDGRGIRDLFIAIVEALENLEYRFVLLREVSAHFSG